MKYFAWTVEIFRQEGYGISVALFLTRQAARENKRRLIAHYERHPELKRRVGKVVKVRLEIVK